MIEPTRFQHSSAGAALAREIDAWRSAGPTTATDGLALARLITWELRRIGRHALPPPLLDALAEIAERSRGRDPFLDDYLDAVLARHEDRFQNSAYLALPLLGRILDDPASDPERLSALLLADVVRHEGRHRDRTAPGVSCKRVRQAARFVWAVDRSLDSDIAPPATLAGAWFELTALPVSTEHDEYFFIRALQARELVFTTLTDLLRGATTAARSGRLDEATSTRRTGFGRVRAGEPALSPRGDHECRCLSRLPSIHRRSERHPVRGLQAFEIACGEPSTARLASEAFAGVPAVREEADDHDNLAARPDGPRRRRTEAGSGGDRRGGREARSRPPAVEDHAPQPRGPHARGRFRRGTQPECPTWPRAARTGSWASATTPQPDPACAAEPPTCMGGGSRRAAPQGAVQALDVRERVAPVLGPSGCQFAFSGPVSPGCCLWPACGSRRRRKGRAATHKGEPATGWPAPPDHRAGRY